MNIDEEMKNIQNRNRSVELDKKWETSLTRRLCIMILTYIIIVIYSYLIRNNNNIFLSSIVPVIGYLLSTLSLKLIRNIWEHRIDLKIKH